MFLSRLPATILLAATALAMAAEARGGLLPTVSWLFSFEPWEIGKAAEDGKVATLNPGWIIAPLLAAWALASLVFGPRRIAWNPLTVRRFRRFRSLRRGYVSFLILCGLIVLAMLDQAVVGKRALAVHHEGQWHFPAFTKNIITADTFGMEGSAETNYRELQEIFRTENNGNFVIMPLVPWDPVFDSDSSQRAPLVEGSDGLFRRSGQTTPHSGLAFLFYEDKPETAHTEVRYRRGRLEGRSDGFSPQGDRIVTREYRAGEVTSESILDETAHAEWLDARATSPIVVLYPPVAPSWEDRHYLGTDSKGWDILAQLYGGFQVVLQAVVFYLAVTYFLGITLGSLMGYFGGVFDIVAQRFIEVLSNIPFLYLVIIIVSRFDSDGVSLALVVGIICIFSWIGISYYMRTATYKDKERDYVAAARVLGAGTPRVIFRHIMPNAISTIVTLIPFSVASITTALTALDFIGFGLPSRYASWGRVLGDGLDNLAAGWIVGSVFVGLVLILTLVSFVGEAIREAYDPRQFTTYQ